MRASWRSSVFREGRRDSGRRFPAAHPSRLALARPSTIGDLLVGLVIVLCIPFVILALGIPIALGGRFLLWIAGML